MYLVRFNCVLVATQLDPASGDAIRAAAALARAAGAGLHVVHVAEPTDAAARGDALAALQSAVEAAEPSLAAVSATGGPGVRYHLGEGEPASVIHELAAMLGADLVVVGRHRERGERTLDAGTGRTLGSTALDLIGRVTVPCLVAGEALTLPLSQVLVPIDLSPTARGALAVALSWASALRVPGAEDTRMQVLHVLADGQAGTSGVESSLAREIAEVQKRAGSWAGVSVAGSVARAANVAVTIQEHAAASDTDLIVLGTRGLGGDSVGGLGSVPAALILGTTTPMLLVPPAVWRAISSAP